MCRAEHGQPAHPTQRVQPAHSCLSAQNTTSLILCTGVRNRPASCPAGTLLQSRSTHCSYHAAMLGLRPVPEGGALRHHGRLPLAGVQGQACHAAPLNLVSILHCLQHVLIDAPGSLPQGIQRLIDLQWESTDMNFMSS